MAKIKKVGAKQFAKQPKFGRLFKRAFIVAVCTLVLDFLFHILLTRPIETLTYFVIKFLLSFFVASGMFSLTLFKIKYKRKYIIPITGLIFSTLMSIYYRAWELGEARVPFGSRAPDIIFLQRDTVLFSLTWWLGHALFFVVGVLIAIKLFKD